ncbi:MAG TPA: helix-turn-helix transcriptional regulator [Solirubrobacteraceae bacterium]|nr:helix-turn-helix transcriptional regulator [Solirubrobacteraceae bacterium]
MSSQRIANLTHLRRARDLIDRDYAQPLTIARIARAALMSPSQLSRQFRAAYGETPYEYLMTRRIERAMALLRGGELTVSEVATAVGWRSLGSFSARFRELVGEPPSSYRGRDHSELAQLPGCILSELTRPRREQRSLRDSGRIKEARTTGAV